MGELGDDCVFCYKIGWIAYSHHHSHRMNREAITLDDLLMKVCTLFQLSMLLINMLKPKPKAGGVNDEQHPTFNQIQTLDVCVCSTVSPLHNQLFGVPSNERVAAQLTFQNSRGINRC